MAKIKLSKPNKVKYLSYRESTNLSLEADFEKSIKERATAFSGSLLELKQCAMDNVVRVGIPGSKSEGFSHVPTQPLKSFFNVVHEASPLKNEPLPEMGLDISATALAKDVLVFVNGQFSEQHSSFSSKGLSISPISETLDKKDPLFTQLAELYQNEQDPIASLTQALAQHPVLIDIAPNTQISDPILIAHITNSQASESPIRIDEQIIFRLGRGSRTTVLNQFRGQTVKAPILSSSSLELFIEPDAKCDWITSHETHADISLFSKINVSLQKGSSFSGHYFSIGSKLNRQSVDARLRGEEAYFQWVAGAAVSESNHVHQNLRVLHESPLCQSNQLFKNILSGKARTSVDGTVVVTEQSQRTDAKQLIRNLLISPQAKADNKPNLMIFADDVKCSHGATSGQLDPDQMFYLRSRGLSQEQALRILMLSFLREVFEAVAHTGIKKWLLEKSESILRNTK